MTETLSLNTLYRITDARGDKVIEVLGGTVNIYVTMSEPTSSPITDDFNAFDTVESTDNKSISYISDPCYMYITQNTGTTTNVRISGIRAEAI